MTHQFPATSTNERMHAKYTDNSDIWMLIIQIQELLTWEICPSVLGTGLTGNEPAPETWDGPGPLVLVAFELPAEKDVLLPSSIFISFWGRLTGSKESWNILPEGAFEYALLLRTWVPLSGTWGARISASFLIASEETDDTEGPGCYNKARYNHIKNILHTWVMLILSIYL